MAGSSVAAPVAHGEPRSSDRARRFTIWTDHLWTFYEGVGPAFDFLLEERDYFGPDTDYFRYYNLVYVGPSLDDKIIISWKPSWYVPWIFLQAVQDEGTVWVPFRDLLKKLRISVDTGDCALCEEYARSETSFIRRIWLDLRRKDEVLEQLPRYLKAYGDALRTHYDAVLEQLYREPITVPLVLV